MIEARGCRCRWRSGSTHHRARVGSGWDGGVACFFAGEQNLEQSRGRIGRCGKIVNGRWLL